MGRHARSGRGGGSDIGLSAATASIAFVLVLAPGAGLALALFPPGRASLLTRLGLAVPLGFASVGLLALLLALLHVMTPPAFVPLYAVGTAAAWWRGARRGALSEHLRAWRSEISSERWLFLAGGAVLLALVAVRLTYSPLLNLADQTPLRYWADGVEIADAGRIPEAGLQWGRLIEPTVSKVLLNAFHAASAFVLGRGPLEPLGGLLLLVSVGLVLAAVALGRELGLRRTALLLPVLLFANRVWGEAELTNDLTTYRAENWGRLLVLGGILLAVRAIRAAPGREGRTDALLAGLLLGSAAGTHLVPFAVGAAFVGAYSLAWLLLRRGSWRVLRPVGMAAGVALAVAAAVLLIPRGDVGFQGVAGADAYAELRAALGDEDFDPTLFIARGEVDVDPDPEHPVVMSPRQIVSFFTAAMTGVPRLPGARWILPVVAAGLLVLVLRRGTEALRVATLAAGLLALALLAVSLAFASRYELFALSQFGPRRLFDYAPVPTVLVGLVLAEMGLRAIEGRRIGGRGRGVEAAPAAAAALAVVVAGVLVPTALAPGERLPVLGESVRSFRWIESNLPCEGRTLADRRTLASFQMMTRRAGVLEGMGPHLRPRVLALAVRELLDAEEFFEDPTTGREYLRERGVAAVLVSAPDAPFGGAHRVADADVAALDRAPFLRLADRTDAGRIYEVVGFEPAAAGHLPDVEGLPGYRCGSPAVPG